MNANETVVIGNDSYQIIDRIGSGGQGSVWKIKRLSDGKNFALKILDEKDKDKLRDKCNNIRHLINEKVDKKIDAPSKRQRVHHVFPIRYFTDNNATGYIMDYVSGKTLNQMLMTGKIEKMSMQNKLELVRKIAASISILHDLGYCYTDINWGNFMWDEENQIMHVIDCENVASSSEINDGRCAFLKGTGFFMAPEVAFKMEKAANNADRYALATLIFRILTNNILQSAYHGKAMYSAVPACINMEQVKEYEDEDDIDKNWRIFIFDKTNKSNSIEDIFKKSTSPECKAFRKKLDSVIKIWEKIDEQIKELFYKVFEDPFNYSKRPAVAAWVNAIDEVLGTKKTRTDNIANQHLPAKKSNTTGSNSNNANSEGQASKYPTFVPRGSSNTVSDRYKPFVPKGMTDSTDDRK